MVFWADVVAVIGVHTVFPDAALFGRWALMAGLLATVSLWPALPWRPGTGRRR